MERGIPWFVPGWLKQDFMLIGGEGELAYQLSPFKNQSSPRHTRSLKQPRDRPEYV